MDDIDFKYFLQVKNQLCVRSSNDVLCRLNRGKGFIGNTSFDKPLDENLMLLERADKFAQLPTTVKSQIRRAFKLYYQFNKEKVTE